MDAQKTGALISEVRNEKGLTQTELAKRLNISNRTVSKWENGDGMPDISILTELAAVLEVSTDELLTGERRAVPPPPQEVAAPYPVFKTHGRLQFDTVLAAAKFAVNDREPLWLRIIMCIAMGILSATLVQIAANQADGALSRVLAVVLCVVLLCFLFLPYLIAFVKYSQTKTLNNGAVPDGEFELSDRVYVRTGVQQYTFALSEITGFYQTKTHYILQVNRKVWIAVRQHSFYEGEDEAFCGMLRYHVLNQRKPRWKTVLRAIAAILLLLLCLLLHAVYNLAATDDTPSMTISAIQRGDEEAVFGRFVINYYEKVDTDSADLTLNDEERAALLVTDFYMEFQNGGLCQYLCNSSGKNAATLPECLKALELDALAAAYTEIAADNGLRLEDYQGDTDYYAELKAHDYDAMDAALAQSVQQADIPNAVGKYIQAHPDAFTNH